MVTIRRGVDLINVNTPQEALEVMRSISRHTELPASELADVVGFPGLSVKQTVDAYAAFRKETSGAEVIEFTSCGKKKLWKEVA